MKIIDEDLYNTDGNGVIRIVEREDGRFAEAADPDGPFTGVNAERAVLAGARWFESPNEVIEAWYATFHDGGQLIRPNVSQPGWRMISRRAALAGASAGLFACRPPLAKRFNGYCFVANRTSRTLAVVNLARFQVEKHLSLGDEPLAVTAIPGAPEVVVLLEKAVALVSVGALALTHRIALRGRAVGMRLAGQKLAVLCRDPAAIERIDLKTRIHDRPVPLRGQVFDFDIAAGGRSAVVSCPDRKLCTLVDLERDGAIREMPLPSVPGVVRFRPDGKQILIGSAAGQAVLAADWAAGHALVILPMPFRPERFCFSTDNGGQLFSTGTGMDAVGIIYPYQTELAETVLAGRGPAAMTANSSLLFVANPPSGDVTVLSIAERQVVAKIESGVEPSSVELTPDGEYALILNRGSGDLAVVRLSKLTDLRYKRAPLFTVIAVGEDPIGAAVCGL